MRNTDDMIREIQKYEKYRNMRNTERWEIYSPTTSYRAAKYGGW